MSPPRKAIHFHISWLCSLFHNVNLLVLTVLIATVGYGQKNPELDTLYQLLQSGDDSLKIAAYQDVSRAHYKMGEIDSSIRLCEEAISLIKSKETSKWHTRSQGKLYGGLALCYYRKGDMQKCNHFLDSSYYYYSIVPDTSNMYAVIGSRGTIAEFTGQVDSAVSCYRMVYDYYKRVSDTSGQVVYLSNIAGVYKRKQRYDEATDMYQQVLDLAGSAGLRSYIAKAYKGFGDIGYYQGLYNLALENYNKSIRYFEQTEDYNQLLNVKSNRALVYMAQDEFGSALATYREVLAANRKMGKLKGVLEDYQAIGDIYEATENLDSARWYYATALEIAREIGYPRGEANSLGQLARIYLEQGNTEGAEESARPAIELFEQMDNAFRQWKTTLILAETMFIQGKTVEAQNLADMCYSKGVDLQIMSLKRDAALLQFKIYKSLGRYREALAKLEISQQLTDSLRNEELRESAIRADLEYTYQKASLADSLKAAGEKYALNLAYNEKLEAQKRRETVISAAVLIILLLAAGLWSRVRYVQRSRKRLQVEKDRSDELLLNILPSEVAEELKIHGESQARDFEQVTVLFSDFKEFTQTAERLSAKELVSEINACFKVFDQIIERYGIEKIKTIGDSYMAAGGLHEPKRSEVKDVVLAGLDMQEFMLERKKSRNKKGLPAFEMRVGINTGPVVAGIVGVKKFQYDIWGDTVNTASRMESHGQVGKVNVAQATFDIIMDDPEFTFQSRGKLQVKGKGEIEMWYVNRVKS